MTRRSQYYSRNIDVWPSFPPETVSDAERAQRAEFEELARRFVATRYADDPTAREEVEDLLFAPVGGVS